MSEVWSLPPTMHGIVRGQERCHALRTMAARSKLSRAFKSNKSKVYGEAREKDVWPRVRTPHKLLPVADPQGNLAAAQRVGSHVLFHVAPLALCPQCHSHELLSPCGHCLPSQPSQRHVCPGLWQVGPSQSLCLLWALPASAQAHLPPCHPWLSIPGALHCT